MNSKIQEILIRRKSKVYFNFKPVLSSMYKTANISNNSMVGAIIGNFGSLGFIIDKSLLEALQSASTSELKEFYTAVFPILNEYIGNNYRFKPMYPNFPEQVASATDGELYINAILHYFGDVIGERIIPEYKEEVRFPFCESYNPRFIGLATSDDIISMWDNLFEAKSSPSVHDKKDIDVFFESNNTETVSNKPSFNNKERMAYVLAKTLKLAYYDLFHNWCVGNVKTATDVLRIAVAYSDGDESLTKISRFGKFSRPVRKKLLNILNEMNQNSVKEDMYRFKNVWVRLGEKLHPSEYRKQYPSIASSFDILRNDKIETTNSRIEKYMASSDWSNLLDTLKTRPGDFARRINAIFSKSPDKFAVMEAFKSVIDKVSTPVLWQLHGYFKSRDKQLEFRNRIFLPKTPKALVSKNNLVPISLGYQTGMVQIIDHAIKSRYSNNGIMGKVYIDPICNNLLIPSGNRSASNALRQVARGSRFKIGDNKSTVRLFVYWKDVENGDTYGNRVDLDLSAIMYDKDFKTLGHCSWTQLRNGTNKNAKMVHSGDITSAPNGASEFLDINLDKLEKEVAYIGCNVYCYTGQKMNQLDVGFCGWMEREYAGSGEIFEPKSVVGRCDLTADATSTCPMILDVNNREIVWTDLAISLTGSGYSVERTIDKSIATAELATRMSTTKSTLFDVFYAHILARDGILVDCKEDADFVISEDGDVSPFDISKVMAEWV